MSNPNQDPNLLTIGLAQIAPCWMDRARTLEKVEAWVERASGEGCHLVAFGRPGPATEGGKMRDGF